MNLTQVLAPIQTNSRHLLIVIHDRADVGAHPAPGVVPGLVARQEVVVHAHVVPDLVGYNLESQDQIRQSTNLF